MGSNFDSVHQKLKNYLLSSKQGSLGSEFEDDFEEVSHLKDITNLIYLESLNEQKKEFTLKLNI